MTYDPSTCTDDILRMAGSALTEGTDNRDIWMAIARDGRTDWTYNEVDKWREANNLTWHERNDMKTCDLVPSKINSYFGHLDGVSECKREEAKAAVDNAETEQDGGSE